MAFGETVPVPRFNTCYLSPLAVVCISFFWPLSACPPGAALSAGLSTAGSVALLQPSRQMAAANVTESRAIIFNNPVAVVQRPASFRQVQPKVKPCEFGLR